MFEIFWKIGTRREHATGDETSVLADPLSHPDIERMSERELADLPLWPRRPAPRSAAAGPACGCAARC